MAAFTIIPEILDFFIISPILVPKIQNTKPLISFLTLLAHQKIKHRVQEKKKSRGTFVPN